MALIFSTKPRRWESAQLPVIFEFDYEIVLPPVDPDSDGYIGSYIFYKKTVTDLSGLMYKTDYSEMNEFIVGDSFYIGQGTALAFETPVTVIAKGTIIQGANTIPVIFLDTDWNGNTACDAYTLDFVESFNPTFSLYVSDSFSEYVKYDQDAISLKYRINLSPYLRKYFRNIGYPGMLSGVENTLFKKYRLDYVINSVDTTGTDLYVNNSMIAPTNPTCSDNLPNWQFDLTTLQCEQSAPRTSANRVAKMKDTNVGSPTYNTYRDSGAFFYYDSNATACPLTYSNVAKSQTFRKNSCASGYYGSYVTYTVAANTYTSIISQADADNQALADIAANGQTYANTHGTCTLLNAYIEYRNTTQSGSDADNTYADIYIVFAAGGPITFYYDVQETNTSPSSSTLVEVGSSIVVSGTEANIANAVLVYQNDGTNQFNRSYINLRTTP